MTDLDDHTFLGELARQLGNNPTARISGGHVAEALGHEAADAGQIVQRLKARGFVDWVRTPDRGGWTSRGLALTPAGYDRLGL